MGARNSASSQGHLKRSTLPCRRCRRAEVDACLGELVKLKLLAAELTGHAPPVGPRAMRLQAKMDELVLAAQQFR